MTTNLAVFVLSVAVLVIAVAGAVQARANAHYWQDLASRSEERLRRRLEELHGDGMEPGESHDS